MRRGYYAVHPKYVGQQLNPIFDFGTFLYIEGFDGDSDHDFIDHPDGLLQTLNVQDIGDPSYDYSKYWIDIYWGDYYDYFASDLEYGNQHTVDYRSSNPAKR